MHIYAFGSISRGDVSQDSDVDLLAIVDGFDDRFDPGVFSIYSYKRIREIWEEGNPFAWHLSLESRPIFLSNQIDYLGELGRPSVYRYCVRDCKKFLDIFCSATSSISRDKTSAVFDLSTVFLSIRNIATCFSLGTSREPDFSRNSALRIKDKSLTLPLDVYRIFERARVLCTRGKGNDLTEQEIEIAISSLAAIQHWMERLTKEAEGNE